MSTTNSRVSTVEVDDLDSFLPMPGADDIDTGEASPEAAKPSFFARPADTLDFLDPDFQEGQTNGAFLEQRG